MDMSASVGDVNIHPSTVLGKKSHTRRTERTKTIDKAPAPTPVPAPIVSDATESSEGTCERTAVPSPPLMRKRGSSWSLATEGKSMERRTITTETAQGSSTVENVESPSVPQHEIQKQPPCVREFISMAQLGNESLLKRLTAVSAHGNLTMINFSRRRLTVNDAGLIREAMHQNPHLSVLKLGYNNFRDEGTAVIASAFVREQQHHSCLSLLDLGFNGIGDEGCAALALHAVAGNFVLHTLCLTGNKVQEKGALSLAGAILHGSGLKSLHLTANGVGVVGTKALTRAITEGEGRRQLALSSGDERTIAITGTVEELHLTSTGMGSLGFLSVSNMLLSNFSLRVLCLSNNGINDSDMALLSQSLGQNKDLPLEVLKLSFNQISCLGVECLMNAVWGSKTLRVMSLDHNRLGDRGAQLAAVVLTSINLEILDISFNRVGSLGVKALMKSLSENSSLQSLVLSGIPLDAAASKAVCYALAYNHSLRSFHVDSCSIGYAAQRHIVAGIVSNRYASLRVLTGFELGAIAVTLGLPKELQDWRNDQILGFVRLMWRCWRKQQPGPGNRNELQGRGNDSDDTDWDQSLSDNVSSEGQQSESTHKAEPADPKTVVTASNLALRSLGESGGETLRIEPYQRERAETSPLVPVDATLLERTVSGSVEIPSFDHLKEEGQESSNDAGVVEAVVREDTTPSPTCLASLSDEAARKRNLQWLSKYCWVLNEICLLPFSDADFYQLEQYFYSASLDSPVGDDSHRSKFASENDRGPVPKKALPSPVETRAPQCPLPRSPSINASLRINLDADTSSDISADVGLSNHSKRLSSELDNDEDIEVMINETEPPNKRSRNTELRISRYPRLREELECSIATQSQDRALVLMRQLRFVENKLSPEDAPDENRKPALKTEKFTPCDIEMIILDLV